MTTRRVEVVLSDSEEEFIKWMAKRDKVSFQQELRMIFFVEMYQCIELYKEEMQNESKRDA